MTGVACFCQLSLVVFAFTTYNGINCFFGFFFLLFLPVSCCIQDQGCNAIGATGAIGALELVLALNKASIQNPEMIGFGLAAFKDKNIEIAGWDYSKLNNC